MILENIDGIEILINLFDVWEGIKSVWIEYVSVSWILLLSEKKNQNMRIQWKKKCNMI